jgi:hypothetical protein
VCVELFNGECELYKSYGLEGVKTLRYVADDGRRVSVNLVASLFVRSSGAFGFFTRRVLGENLPSQITVKPLAEVEGRAAKGVGIVYLWRGKQVVELVYVSEDETPEEIELHSDDVLVPLASAISKGLVGATTPQREATLLETFGADEQGVLIQRSVLNVPGSGFGALGYFSEAVTPHRMFVAARHDETGVKDLLRLLQRAGGYKKLKGTNVSVLRMTAEGRPPETWYVQRQGELLLGVGPLETVETASPSTPKERKARALAWKHFAVKKLTELSAHVRNSAASNSENAAESSELP